MNPNRLSIRCAVATAVFCVAGLAMAQERAPSLEEVVVTAQKRAERLIDVPVAITAVSGESLTQENLTGIIDYFSRIPSLQYSCNKTYCLSLRGLSTGGATNPTVGILIDDIPFGSTLQSGSGNARFPDIDPSLLEGIEVLRGPQGTLYGASSIGGLIKYVTRQPQADELFGRVEAGISSVTGGSTEWNARGYLNVPLWSDRIGLLVSGFTREDPAYIDNINANFAGKDVNTTEIHGGSAALLFKVTDDLSITLKALRQERDAKFSPSIQSLPATPGLPPTYEPRFGRNTINLSGTSDVGNQELYSARIDWAIGGVQLTSLTSWSESTGTNIQDLSAVFVFIPPQYGFAPGGGAVVNINDIGGGDKFTQELRLSGTSGALDWRVGVFYTDEDGSVDQTLTLFDPAGSLVGDVYVGKSPVSYEERAIFADATWRFSDRWAVQAGVRYAENDQSSGGSTTVDAPLVPFFGPTRTDDSLKSSDDSVTFQISPTYRFNDDLMGYLRVSSGYRPGGPNAALPGVPASYAPDEVVNYELGLKGYAANRTVSFDVAAFVIDWTDIQLQNTDAVTQFTYTTNGGKARSTGLEGSVEFRPWQGGTITANATLLDAELSQDLPVLADADSLLGGDGDRLPGSARFSGNLGILQEFSLSPNVTANVGATLIYVGSRRSEFINTNAFIDEEGTLASRFDLPDYTQLDLRAGIGTESGWSVDLYARNVTDEEGVITAINRNGTNTSSVVFLQPRTWGLAVSKRF